MHFKVTSHFLRQARERCPPSDLSRLWDLLLSGRLEQAARMLGPREERGAVALGSSYVVFKIDQKDRWVVALLTILSAKEGATIARRRDTRLIRTS